MNISVVKKNTKPLYINSDGDSVVYHKGLLVILDKRKRKKNIIRLPLSFTKRAAVRIRFFERMLRLVPRGAEFLDDGCFVFAYNGKIYKADLTEGAVTEEYRLLRGMNSPLAINKIEKVEGFEDCLVFGDYTQNKDCKPVSIYARGLGKECRWEKKFEFADKQISHVHAVIADPYRKGLIVLNGDSNKGSAVWLIRDNYRSAECLVSGMQKYRSCAAAVLKEGIIYATDTPLEQNFLYELSRRKGEWKTREICKLSGPSVYSVQTENGIYFSTTVEPDSRLSYLKKMFSTKPGEGVKDKASHIVRYASGEAKEILFLEKDVFPMGLLQFGSIQFPKQYESHCLHAYVCGLKKYDGCWIRITL